MAVVLPCRLGPYLLLRHLATGGMGAVYLAHEDHEGTPRLCVVKTVRNDYAGDRVAARRFVDEAHTSALLTHPNVVAVHDVGEAGGTAYIAVEYVAGRDLMAIFLAAQAAGSSVPPAVALHIIAELLDALDYVHHATDPRSGEPLHVVHRDVSPQNVLVGFDGHVKLIDFGIARSAVREELTRVGQLVGTLRYVSPEQARGEPVNGATDVWATCVTACELLTGERFWGARTAEAVAPLLAIGERVEPAGLTGLDGDIQVALRAGLNPEASQRPSAAKLRDLLRALADKRGLREPAAQTRAVMEQLFAGEEVRERQARTALLQEPTVVRAAAMPDSAVYDEGQSDPDDPEPQGSRTDHLTVGMRPFVLPDTRVLEPTPQSAPFPPSPSRAQRRSRPKVVPWQLLVAAGGSALLVLVVGLWIASASSPRPPIPPDEASAPSVPARAPLAPAATTPGPAPAELATAVLAAPPSSASVVRSTDAAPTPRPTRKASRPKKPEARPRLFGDRVRALRECEPRPACAASVLRQAEDVTALSLDELRALDTSLERCLQRCR
ncbi:MAG: protein kinase [Deltaproteobacteria bacterium]|nr:protein kinase [Deltaproteobacteria bacterium]